MKWIYTCLAFCLLAMLPAVTAAQLPELSNDTLHVYLITLGPGSDPWEKFGHDFIDIEDPTRVLVSAADENKTWPYRLSYNWGVFDFGTGISGISSFGWHFLQGKLQYSMQHALTDTVIKEYTSTGRFVLKQELQLTLPQKLELLHRLEVNDTDANRYYLYDYFVKNCSTMTRDAIDETVGGRVHAALAKIPTRSTLRSESLRCTSYDVWLYVFLDCALGHPTDQPMSAWEESFIPMKLASHLTDVMVPGPNGKMVSLIKSSEVLGTGIYPERQTTPAYFFYGFLFAGLGFAVLLMAMAFYANRFAVAKWGFVIGGMIWSLVAGVLGLLLSLVWLTDHQAAKWNENWFQANLLSLLLVVLIPAHRKWPNAARKMSFIVLGLSMFNLLAKVTPWFYQGNGSIIAFALPMHIAIAWGLIRISSEKKLPGIEVEQPNAQALHAA